MEFRKLVNGDITIQVNEQIKILLQHKEIEELRPLLNEALKQHSDAIRLLSFVWRTTFHSYRNLNTNMQRALALAIESMMKFDEDDFILMERNACNGGFNASFWIGDGEEFYRKACENSAGCNTSACIAMEKWYGRKPFILKDSQMKSGRRLAVNSNFLWLNNEGKRERVYVTSFKPKEDAIIACSYDGTLRREANIQYGQGKILHRYTITRAQIQEAGRAFTEARKPKKEKKDEGFSEETAQSG